MSQKLVAYFSVSGNTAKLARTLASAAEAELYEIRPALPYTRRDLNWMDKKSRSTLEMQDKDCRPALAKSSAPGTDWRACSETGWHNRRMLHGLRRQSPERAQALAGH